MNAERMLEIGTQGACGLIALAFVVRHGATPLIRYGGKNAVHAAARLPDGRMINLGSDDELVEVSEQELRRANTEDFNPARLNLKPGELREVLRRLEF